MWTKFPNNIKTTNSCCLQEYNYNIVDFTKQHIML